MTSAVDPGPALVVLGQAPVDPQLSAVVLGRAPVDLGLASIVLGRAPDDLGLALVVPGRAPVDTPPPPQRTILSLKNTVQTGVFVGHTVRCTRQRCEKAGTSHPAHSTHNAMEASNQHFFLKSPCCGPASCEKLEHAPRA